MGSRKDGAAASSTVHLQLWGWLSAGQGTGGHTLLWRVSLAGSVGGRAPPGLGHLGNTRSRSSSFGNPGHPPGVAQPWLLSLAFPPATGAGKLFWMESCGSLAPSDGNLSRSREGTVSLGYCTGTWEHHLVPQPGTEAPSLAPLRSPFCPTVPQMQGCQRQMALRVSL